MSPAVAASDLLSTDVYALVRPAYRARIIELKTRRRVLVGPHVSIVFESRETVLYQIQEVLWAERPTRPARIVEEIAEYERLVPREGELTATLMIHGGPPEAGRLLMEGLVARRTAVFLHAGGRTIGAEALSPLCDVTCPVQYLRFPLDRDVTRMLVEGSAEVRLGVAHCGAVEIVPLSRATTDELAADLGAARASDARLTPVLLSLAIPS